MQKRLLENYEQQSRIQSIEDILQRALGGWSHSFSHSHEFHGHHHGGLLEGGGFNPYGGYYHGNHWGRKKLMK
ncbi:hypothetical protein GCK72_002492 [Caenorhabditis remanei]|uniref:Uncharacterized protein n=1 Tax=Caenorhabditis remanei TaxID=31234 RepID=A0A6A5HU55_CAERE|nr:hypothetical protein GCK72_002492 [Caenorhabditis remanei]KAF1770671.1 hypothetical protein GCK72_002492 [Caenorhabditis remanei]